MSEVIDEIKNAATESLQALESSTVAHSLSLESLKNNALDSLRAHHDSMLAGFQKAGEDLADDFRQMKQRALEDLKEVVLGLNVGGRVERTPAYVEGSTDDEIQRAVELVISASKHNPDAKRQFEALFNTLNV